MAWTPKDAVGHTETFVTCEEAAYPEELCVEYAKLVVDRLGKPDDFVEVLPGEQAILSTCVSKLCWDMVKRKAVKYEMLGATTHCRSGVSPASSSGTTGIASR